MPPAEINPPILALPNCRVSPFKFKLPEAKILSQATSPLPNIKLLSPTIFPVKNVVLNTVRVFDVKFWGTVKLPCMLTLPPKLAEPVMAKLPMVAKLATAKVSD